LASTAKASIFLKSVADMASIVQSGCVVDVIVIDVFCYV
jgi:hypothetical protein